MPPLYVDPDHKVLSVDGLKKAVRLSVVREFVRRSFGLEFYVKLRYFFHTKRWPDISNPERFTEKILHRILRTNDPRFAQLSDKYKVRDYISKKVGDDVLIPLLGVYDQISPSDIHELNQPYVVLKNNHDCGSATIVSAQDKNLEAVCDRLNANTKKIFGQNTGEYWYKDIPPKIIAERFIGDDDGVPPSDYRFNVFNQGDGEFKMVIAINYGHGESRSVTRYDENLNILPFTGTRLPDKQIKRKSFPVFKKMKKIVKQLAADFDYVRVDLYENQGCVYFGELTFSPNAGRIQFNPDKYDFWMGNLWKE